MMTKNKNVYVADDYDDLFVYLVSMVNDEEDVTAVVEYDAAVKLLALALKEDFHVEFIEIDTFDYDDLYFVSLYKSHDAYMVSVEKAFNVEGDSYLWTESNNFLDYNSDYADEFAAQYKDDFTYFSVGPVKDKKTFTYANSYSGGSKIGDIFVESNDPDFVEAVKRFFEMYYKG